MGFLIKYRIAEKGNFFTHAETPQKAMLDFEAWRKAVEEQNECEIDFEALVVDKTDDT